MSDKILKTEGHGADGMQVVVPFSEPAYHLARPPLSEPGNQNPPVPIQQTPTICGLRRAAFWLSLAVAILTVAVVGIAIGLGVGLSQSHKDSPTSTTSSAPANSSTTASATQTSCTSGPTTVAGNEYWIWCGYDFEGSGKTTLLEYNLPTMGDCVALCNSMNQDQARQDVGATWLYNNTGIVGYPQGKCWCVGGTNTSSVTMEKSTGKEVAKLQT